jgi:hypothetical protein
VVGVVVVVVVVLVVVVVVVVVVVLDVVVVVVVVVGGGVRDVAGRWIWGRRGVPKDSMTRPDTMTLTP